MKIETVKVTMELFGAKSEFELDVEIGHVDDIFNFNEHLAKEFLYEPLRQLFNYTRKDDECIRVAKTRKNVFLVS